MTYKIRSDLWLCKLEYGTAYRIHCTNTALNQRKTFMCKAQCMQLMDTKLKKAFFSERKHAWADVFVNYKVAESRVWTDKLKNRCHQKVYAKGMFQHTGMYAFIASICK